MQQIINLLWDCNCLGKPPNCCTIEWMLQKLSLCHGTVWKDTIYFLFSCSSSSPLNFFWQTPLACESGFIYWLELERKFIRHTIRKKRRQNHRSDFFFHLKKTNHRMGRWNVIIWFVWRGTVKQRWDFSSSHHTIEKFFILPLLSLSLLSFNFFFSSEWMMIIIYTKKRIGAYF